MTVAKGEIEIDKNSGEFPTLLSEDGKGVFPLLNDQKTIFCGQYVFNNCSCLVV